MSMYTPGSDSRNQLQTRPGTRPGWDRPNNPTPAQWEEVKEIFVGYYYDLDRPEPLTLNQIRRVMAEKHNFRANRAQYKRRINKWGLRRYLNQPIVKYMLRVKDRRTRIYGKKTAFRFHGKPVPEKRLESSGQPTAASGPELPVTPPYISYSTPADAAMDTTPVDVDALGANDSAFDQAMNDEPPGSYSGSTERAWTLIHFAGGYIDLDTPATTPLEEAVTLPSQRAPSEDDRTAGLAETALEDAATDLLDAEFRQLHFPDDPAIPRQPQSAPSPRPPSPPPPPQFLRPPSPRSDPFHPGKNFFGYGEVCRKRSVRGCVWMSSAWGGESVMGSWVKDDFSFFRFGAPSIVMSERWPFGSDSHSVCDRDSAEKGGKEDPPASASDASAEPARPLRLRDSIMSEVLNSVNFQLFTKV